MGCSGRCMCTVTKQRAERRPVIVPGGEEDGTDPQELPQPLVGLGARVGLLPARAANPCLSRSTFFQLSSDFPQTSTEIGGKSTPKVMFPLISFWCY